ncbi:ArnT family glycosyltransferase [Longispora albida]|uniref:ArnT family glycosyltransferase n=1 Tax=Longispora albida TaxID=203523 RepID=UPI0003658C0F|nr:glycosyltransferase family 39 protein [Longispora albida]
MDRQPSARLPVGLVALGVSTLLLLTSGGYGYHRDELYFRLLSAHPAWGYTDQPPFTPMLVRASIWLFGDTVEAIRVPAALFAGFAAVLLALVAREAGGDARAQVLAALGGGASGYALVNGHLAVTSGPDLVVWLLVILFAQRALGRGEPRWWLAAGVAAGLGLYNKHLVVLLLLGLAAGLLAAGPRRVLASPWLWAGVAVAVVIGAPNLWYQVTNGFPQLEMAEAVRRTKGGESRATLLPIQLLVLGPLLVPVWIAGLVRAARRAELRAFAVAYPVILVLVFVTAGQPYYPSGLLLALYAMGCVTAARWFRVYAWPAVALNVVTAIVIALPIVPAGLLGSTPIPEMHPGTRDQIGWEAYAAQAEAVRQGLSQEEQAMTIVLTSNYGEAGALRRFGGTPDVYSGHNELARFGPPPESARITILIARRPVAALGACEERGRLNNQAGVDNEEEGVPIWICRDRRVPWRDLWPQLRHYS